MGMMMVAVFGEGLRANKERFLIAISAIIFFSVMRIAFQGCMPHSATLGFDLFFIVAISAVMAGTFIGGIFSVIVPLTIIGITDIIIGNGYIFIFTWSGFAMMGVISFFMRKKIEFTPKFTLYTTSIGILGVMVYDIWTNFGWWYIYYPHTLEGIILCYIAAIPFILWHLLSCMIVFPIAIASAAKLLSPEIKESEIERHGVTLLTVALVIISVIPLTLS